MQMVVVRDGHAITHKIVAVAIGSSLGDKYKNFLQAEEGLLAMRGCRHFRFSPIYSTIPVESPGSDEYLNGAVSFETSLAPLELLAELQRLENVNGRQRPYTNAPRTLDLDLLIYGEDVITTPELTVPHPRFHQRFFVLTPLVDLDLDVTHPVLGLSLAQLELRLGGRRASSKFVAPFAGCFRSRTAGQTQL